MVKVNNCNTEYIALQTVTSNTSAQIAISTIIPSDDTIPQQTEGDELLTLAITPKSATNLLEIKGEINAIGGFGVNLGALFQDATVNALTAFNITGSGSFGIVVFYYYMTAGTTSSTTFKMRAGPIGAFTGYVNGSSAGRFYGGVSATRITITEYQI